jgi:hypothetical protein
MASREHVVDPFAQGRLPGFYFDHIACPHQGSHSLPEGLRHMQIRAPIGVKGDQHPLRLQGLEHW